MDTDKVIDGLVGIKSYTVGYLLHKGNHGVVVAQTVAKQKEGYEYRHIFEIPTGMIIRVRRLK